MAKQQAAMTAAGASEAGKAAAAEELRASTSTGPKPCGHTDLFSVEHKGVNVLVSGLSKYSQGQPRVKYVVLLQHNEEAFQILGITAYFLLYEPFPSSQHYGKAFMSGSTPYTLVRDLRAADKVALAAEKVAACGAARAAAAAAAAGGGGSMT